ncbi:hypothetical protein K469DRAFT_668936 [Zopfia rhizophila CBS 207.26]|uniref:Uncharacterized protein n=1 Tax=Zopfia rhizophila CBS 207.26 TaxID=1314779 RepID=A0A6A6DTH7_9PEZI|nr:hypothetical protein K469DRAFT_668936 [Zopfia rhizophila CBS 207.26]
MDPWTALHEAGGREAVVRVRVGSGADVNAKGMDPWTALMMKRRPYREWRISCNCSTLLPSNGTSWSNSR